MILVTATGNRLFLPVLQAFMHRKAVEHLPQLCSINPNIPVPMQFISIYFLSWWFLLLSSDSLLCGLHLLGNSAQCQAAIWPCPKWTEQDLSKALFPVNTCKGVCYFPWCSVTGSADSAHRSHIVQSFCWAGYSPSHNRRTAHFYLNYILVLKLNFNFNPLPQCSGLEPQQCHSTWWNTSSPSSPKPLLRIPTTGPPRSYQGKIARRIVQ